MLLHTADIVKMIDSQPDLAQVIRRVRGGYLKIQGTWMPYEVGNGVSILLRIWFNQILVKVALRLSRR
jgi:hypothetical protein